MFRWKGILTGPASSSDTPSGILVAYCALVVTYCWNVPSVEAPLFFCCVQCSSSNPLVQNSQSPQVSETHLIPARSPPWNHLTFLPTATTTPAPSWPETLAFMLTPMLAQSPLIRWTSEWQRPDQLTLTRISPSLGVGTGISSTTHWASGPGRSTTAAF